MLISVVLYLSPDPHKYSRQTLHLFHFHFHFHFITPNNPRFNGIDNWQEGVIMLISVVLYLTLISILAKLFTCFTFTFTLSHLTTPGLTV